jgi:hypothetical protein
MRGALGLAVAIACVLTPASASAGMVYIHEQFGLEGIEYHADPGERNTVDLHWQLGGRWVDIYDNSAVIRTDSPDQIVIPNPNQPPPQEDYHPCMLVDDHHARCVLAVPADPTYTPNLTMPISEVRIYLGDRDDSFRPSWGTDPFWAYVYGEEGNDSITLPPAQPEKPGGSVAYGGPGDDLLVSQAVPGGPGNLLVGDDGNDHFEADNSVQESALCGAGDDYAHVDGNPEDGTLDCETVAKGSLYR